ncbi:MAG: NUDIX hydrolase [Betaproteobacteria bacterium]|nr:NUDIX hydrolase [Betaproteobacteria bacterium]MDH5210059.1 NUDIX hydrolase [Betaproteobacteria bacterium]
MAKDLAETFLDGEAVFAGKLLKVHRDRVRLPDGTAGVREYIRHPGAVAIVALFDDGRVLLERQFRYPLHRVFIEIPAGKLEAGEDHLETGKRELLEETGYVAAEWRKLGIIHNAIGYSDEVIEIWLARGLEMRQQALAEGEFLQVFSVPLAEAQAMARDGRITDVKTIAGLLWVEKPV